MSAFLGGERAAKLVLPLSKLADDVLHDDDRAIDDEAEVDRAETHQVSGDTEARHAGEREQERERDRRGDDERRAPVAEQHEQHDDDEHRAFEQIGFDRVDGAVDELRAVVLDLDFHAVGQLGLNLGDARLHALGHFAAVLAGEHHRRADDRLVAVERGRAGAELRSGLHFGHVFDEQRLHAGAEFERQVGDVLGVVHAAHGADGELLSPRLMMPPPAFSTFCATRSASSLNVMPTCVERIGLGLDDELPLVAAALVDFRDARHGAEQRLDDVFLDFAQLDQLLQFRRGFVRRVGAVLDAVVENFAEAGADGREFG